MFVGPIFPLLDQRSHERSHEDLPPEEQLKKLGNLPAVLQPNYADPHAGHAYHDRMHNEPRANRSNKGQIGAINENLMTLVFFYRYIGHWPESVGWGKETMELLSGGVRTE